jgi:maltose-binding protein MalE
MKKLPVILMLLAIVAIIALVNLPACTSQTPTSSTSKEVSKAAGTPTLQAVSTEVKQLATQLPGVLDSVNTIIQAAPNVDANTKTQIAGYTVLAQDAVQATSAVTGVTSPDQLSGAFTAIANLAQAAPLDASTKSQVGNYVAWGSLLLKLAGVVVPLFT